MKIDNSILIFNALSQETRLRVFKILVKNSRNGITPTEISEKMGNMPRNTLSFHLNLLTLAGLCSSKKNGKQIVYKPSCDSIRKVASFLLHDCCEGDCKC
jgi:DNA-binding transcriptional ArsR family regulator